jgi:short-subunit dehydrogenase
MAGFAPIPVKNMYSATKSAVVVGSYFIESQFHPYMVSIVGL